MSASGAKCSLSGVQRIAHLQFAERFPEWMHTGRLLCGAAHPASGDARDGLRTALNRCALHVVHEAADAAHLFTTTSTARTAVHESRQRRAVSGRILRAIAIDDQQTAVKWRQSERELDRGIVVGRED
jgi:hypothetical protein